MRGSVGERRGPQEMNAFCGMVLGEVTASVMAEVYYGLMLYIFLIDIFKQPANGSYPSFYARGDRHRKDVCRVYTTVWGLQYQELRMGLWAEERTGMKLRDFPGAAWV